MSTPRIHLFSTASGLLSVCLLLLIGGLLPAGAEEVKYKKGDAVMVDVSGDGKTVYKGVVQEVYDFAAGTSYSVKWDEGSGFKDSQSGTFPAGRMAPRGGAKPKTVPRPGKAEPEPGPAPEPENPSADEPDNAPGAEPVKYKKGDEVMVHVSRDGKQVYRGIVQEVYDFAAGTSYSVKWDEGSGFKDSQSGTFPADRMSPRGDAKPKPAPRPPKPGPQPDPKPTPTPQPGPPAELDPVPGKGGAEPQGTNVADEDSDYFVGQWKLTKWGGGTEFVKDGDLYKEWLLYVSPGAPVTINKNHTYTWFDEKGKPFKGEWRPLTAKEDHIAGGKTGIMLIKGLGGIDWQMDFMGVKKDKDLIRLKSDKGSFDGERVGASKGEPEWNKLKFAKGDKVVVILGAENKEYDGVIDNVLPPDSTGIVLYHALWTEDGVPKSGKVQAIKLRRR